MSARGRLRTFALVGVAAIVAAGCTSGSGGGDKAGGGGEPVVLRMADATQRDTELGFTPAVEYFVQRVRQLSGGNIRIDVVDGWGNFLPDASNRSCAPSPPVPSTSAGREHVFSTHSM